MIRLIQGGDSNGFMGQECVLMPMYVRKARSITVNWMTGSQKVQMSRQPASVPAKIPHRNHLRQAQPWFQKGFGAIKKTNKNKTKQGKATADKDNSDIVNCQWWTCSHVDSSKQEHQEHSITLPVFCSPCNNLFETQWKIKIPHCFISFRVSQ